MHSHANVLDDDPRFEKIDQAMGASVDNLIRFDNNRCFFKRHMIKWKRLQVT